MQTLKAIHQFAVACSPGDGITNAMFFTRRLLRSCGLESQIYSIDVPPELKSEIFSYRDYLSSSDQLLLIHHACGNPLESWLRELPDIKFLVYHNITPERFYADGDPVLPILRHGREQLTQWHAWLDGAIADSELNRQELLDAGFSSDSVTTLPLLVDLARFDIGRPIHASSPPAVSPWRLLFVGRLAPNKNQAGLIAMAAALNAKSPWPVTLTLVGGGDDAIRAHLLQLAEEYRIADHVHLMGKVSDEELVELYRQADLYVSLSDHEGFGMPLVEAMAFDVPVLAYAAPDSSVADTLGPAGLLLESAEPNVAAAAALLVLENPGVRAELLKAQRQRLADFEPASLLGGLKTLLESRGLTIPSLPELSSCLPQQYHWRLEGPFDSSYSLALVNRELARALVAEGDSVSLYATEGGGDLPVDQDFLAANPDLAMLNDQADRPAWYNATLRLCYPPRTTEMSGVHRVFSCYGWEESVFPHEYAQSFNSRLSMVTTMSRYVSRTLADSGVGLPLPVVGVGTDHILHQPVDDSALDGMLDGLEEPRLTYLHVSSCFPRKGVDVLLEAWSQAFTAADAVLLVIKTFPNPHHDMQSTLEQWRQRHPAAAPIRLLNTDMPAGGIRALYRRADVLVAPSRGEGYGLPMAEAMWHDLPVITTASGGQSDFCTDETAWLADFHYARAQTHMQQFSSVWVEPEVADIVSLMREFLDHHRAGDLESWTRPRRQRARQCLEEAHTWAAVAKRSRQALVSLDETLPQLTPRPSIGWVSSWNSKCGIATYSRLLVGPALADQVHVLANSDAEVAGVDGERVSRCWRTIQPDGKGGYDEDPLDTLYEEIIARDLDTVVIQFNFSFLGLSPLQRLLERLHEQAIKTLVFFHSTADVEWGGLSKSLAQMASALRHCDRLMVHSVADLNRLKALGLDANATLFPHGVMDNPPMQEPDDPRFRALEGKTVIASYGFLLPHKGIHELIEAFATLVEQHHNVHLLLLNALYPAPPSEQEQWRCKEIIEELGLAQHVTMINDFLPDDLTLGWLQQADLLVFPYQHTQESSSAAVRWGLASGRPVACTPLDIFEDVAEAVAFLPGTTPAEIAQGIAPLLRDTPERRALQETQQAWLHAHAWPRLSQRLKGLVTALAWSALEA